MTSTSLYNKKPLFYTSQNKCLVSKHNKSQTNNKYKHFKHDVYHAATEEQFVAYCNTQNKITLDTFRYIFYKMKKGIFIKIHNGLLDVFLPFYNVAFTNEWSDKLMVNSLYKDFDSFFKHVTALSGHKFNKYNILNDRSKWYCNNSLFRYENPVNENDTNINCIKHMFQTLCDKTENLPDIEFFINKRNFPILTTNNHITMYGVQLLKNCCPIHTLNTLLYYQCQHHKDIPI